MTTPLFSIVVPTHERPRLLHRALRSIVLQDFTDYEVVVVNDGSKLSYDRVLDFCDATNLKNFKYIKMDENLGVSLARNAGARVASGRYVTFLDDDDELLPGFLTATCEALVTNDRVGKFGWCGVRHMNYDSFSGTITSVSTRTFSGGRSKVLLYEDLMSIGIGFGITIERNLLERLGSFDISFQLVEDADLFLRLIDDNVDPIIIPGVHVILHNHSGPRLTGRDRHELRIIECQRLLDSHKGVFERYPTLEFQLQGHVSRLKSMRDIDEGSPARDDIFND